MRLVPNQDADDIFKKYSDYVKKITPKGIKTNIKVHSKGPACVVNTDNKYARAAVDAMHESLQEGHGVHPLGRLDSYRDPVR